MTSTGLFWGSIAAAGGILAASWSYVRSIFAQLIGRVIITAELEADAARAVMLYLNEHLTPSAFGNRAYSGTQGFIRPLGRRACVLYEITGSTGKLWWRGWRWIRVTHQGGYEQESFRSALGDRDISISFLRGMFDLDQLLREATEFFNERMYRAGQRRFRIIHITGTSGKQQSEVSLMGHARGHEHANSDILEELLQHRLLHWKIEDLGPEVSKVGLALSRLALSAEAEDLVESIKQWVVGEQWYREHGMPWKRGVMLYGKPGTGKTALTRALAEDLDLPVHVYDLATLFNDELRMAWARMLSDTPCIALFEDLDSVFEGRENQRGSLTFDCLLNCIDGVERTSGVLVMITTNKVEKMDDALSGRRPGRIDRVVEMGILSSAGRAKLAERILAEHPDAWDHVASTGKGMTGAAFQEFCAMEALQRRDQQGKEPVHACRVIR